MHMVTETRQLRDGEKLTEFFNHIDWKPLFEFVRRYFGIGVEQPPTTCLKPNGRIEVSSSGLLSFEYFFGKRLQRHFFGRLFAADIFAETHRIFRRVQLRKPVQC